MADRMSQMTADERARYYARALPPGEDFGGIGVENVEPVSR